MPRKYRMKRHAAAQPLDDSYRLIPLTQGQNAIVDVSDYDWLNQWNWHSTRTTTGYVYARRRIKHKKPIYMHREILGCKPGEEGDHISGNTLDNRRKNLRRCTHAQNVWNGKLRRTNTSGFKGVIWGRKHRKWVSQITVGGKIKRIGSFADLFDAARAYDEAARKYRGEFASLNSYGPNPEKCQ